MPPFHFFTHTITDATPYQTIENDDHFEKSLYRNSNVYRVILGDKMQLNEIKLNCWNRINLKLVTEMGLPAPCDITHISCQLLEKKGHYYSTSIDFEIEYHLDSFDPWRNTDHGSFNLQYRILLFSKSIQSSSKLFININVLEHQSLSLCIGPFQQKQGNKKEIIWDNNKSYNMYRISQLGIKDNFSLLQEIWDHGTPGKLWDSALVMNIIFQNIFRGNKEFIAEKKILDMSAGVGAVGLMLAQLCQYYQVYKLPHIVLTDLEEALPLIDSNRKLNSISDTAVTIQALRWGSRKDIDSVLDITKGFDYIFVSDVLYNVHDFPSLISTLYRLTYSNKQTVIFLGYKPRGLKSTEEDIFFNGCKAYFNIKNLYLDSFTREFDTVINYTFNFDILEETGVCLYKLIRK